MGYIFTVVTMGLLRVIETMGILRAIETMGLVRVVETMGLYGVYDQSAKHGPITDCIMGRKQARVGIVRSWADHNGTLLIGRFHDAMKRPNGLTGRL